MGSSLDFGLKHSITLLSKKNNKRGIQLHKLDPISDLTN